MKMKKFLAVLLSVVMLVCPLMISSFAAEGDPTVLPPQTFSTQKKIALSLTSYQDVFSALAAAKINVVFDSSAVTFPDGNTKITYVADAPYIIIGEEKVFLTTENVSDFDYSSLTTTIEIYLPLTVTVESGSAYGTLYATYSNNLSIFGFTESFIFDPIVSASVKTPAVKASYLENETFDPAGLVISVQKSSEANASPAIAASDVTYNDSTKADFSFSSDASNPLKVSDKSVDVYYKGVLVGTVPVTVTHNFTDWKEARAATFFSPLTLCATCSECGETFYKYVPGTEGYLTAFAGNDNLLAIMSYVAVFFKVVDGFSKNIITEVPINEN